MTGTGPFVEAGGAPETYYERTHRVAGVLVHPDFGQHATGEHPDNQQKVDRIANVLFAMPWADRLMRFYPRYARPEQIALAHDERYVRLIESASRSGIGWFDTDTRVGPGSYETALLAAGGVISAVEQVMIDGYHRPDSIFCITRPPGHHARADEAMGFCIFNNVAVAARYAQRTFGLERVMIVDWDVHQGNGTAEIFAEDPSVLFFSIHQWPHYPGTGWCTDIGQGDGTGYTVNIPVPPGAGDSMYGAVFERIITPITEQFKPELILVSAGQDCHCSDPLADINVTYAGLQMMERTVRDLADRHCGGRHVLALEGGYNQHTLPYTVSAIIAAMADLPWEIEDTLGPESDTLTTAQDERLREVIAALSPYWTF